MSSFDAARYGESGIADDYDDLYVDEWDTAGAVERLAALAGGGPVLELGIGTGRLALPLVERGIRVDGIDGSTTMVDRLRAKPGSDQIDVVIGDFATTGTGRTYSLVVLAVNTIFALPDQAAQVACFANAARHLRPGGAFVIEAWIPDVGAFRDNRLVRQRILGDDVVSIETARLEPATQHMRTTQVVLRDGSVRLYPANHRYAWPAELDLMARLAGLVPDERWSDWNMSSFDDASRNHVSVYRKPQRTTAAGSAGDGR